MKARNHGFTLLEMLIALSLLGLMLILIGSALTSSRHTLEMTERYAARLTEIRAAQDFLRDSLQQALPISLNGDSHSVESMFEGSSDHLRFAATLPRMLNGGLQVHTLKSVNDSLGAKSLIISFTQLEDGMAWGKPQVLLTHIQRLSFSYRGRDDQQKPTNWLPTWPWPKRLPNYVRMNIESEGPVHWPPLIVALRTNLDLSGRVQ